MISTLRRQIRPLVWLFLGMFAACTPSPGSGPLTSPSAAPVVTKSSVTLAVNEEPTSGSVWQPLFGLGAQLERDLWSDPLTWYDAKTRELRPTGITLRWESMAPERWRFHLRPGVKFHNGEPWNAAAAAFGLSVLADPALGHESYQYAGPVKGVVVDDLTLDVVCPAACPLLPRQTMQTVFQAPEWWKSASPEERKTRTVSTGPFQMVEWKRGEYVKSTAYASYVPVPDVEGMRKPAIKDVTLIWRKETSVLAALPKSGEADMAWDIGTEAKGLAPKAISGETTTVFAFTIDTIWHPELKKLQVRQAIAQAVDCKAIVKSIYAGQTECRGNIAFPGVLGITDRNAKPYDFDPAASKRLLQEAKYDPKNVIVINIRAGRTPKGEEVGEAIQGYLKAVGMNVQLRIVESAAYTVLSNCGFAQTGATATQPPPNCQGADMIGYNPNHDDMQFGRQIEKRMDCKSKQAFFCDRTVIQPQLQKVNSLAGQERAAALTSLADFVHDQVIFLPVHQQFITYAMTTSLDWTPRFDSRVRLDTLTFKK